MGALHLRSCVLLGMGGRRMLRPRGMQTLVMRSAQPHDAKRSGVVRMMGVNFPNASTIGHGAFRGLDDISPSESLSDESPGSLDVLRDRRVVCLCSVSVCFAVLLGPVEAFLPVLGIPLSVIPGLLCFGSGPVRGDCLWVIPSLLYGCLVLALLADGIQAIYGPAALVERSLASASGALLHLVLESPARQPAESGEGASHRTGELGFRESPDSRGRYHMHKRESMFEPGGCAEACR